MSTPRNKTLDALKKFSNGKCRDFAYWCAGRAVANDFGTCDPSIEFQLNTILAMASKATKKTGMIHPEVRRACQRAAWDGNSGMAKGVVIVALEADPRQAASAAASALIFQEYCEAPGKDLWEFETAQLPLLVKEFEDDYPYLSEGE